MQPDDPQAPHQDCYPAIWGRFMSKLAVVLIPRLEYDWPMIRSILDAMDEEDDLHKAA